MSSFTRFLAAGLFGLSFASAGAAPLAMDLYKSPQCGCCGHYVTYLKEQGFRVTVHDTGDMTAVKRRLRVGGGVSCHTAVIGGYTIEGHVPAASIRKLLKERPRLIGIALPGMPATSPGMGPERKGSLTVMTIPAAGAPAVFDTQ